MNALNNDTLSGKWAYRSLLNNPDLSVNFDALEFGQGTISLQIAGGAITGTIGGSGWQLALKGSLQYGSPATLWFQGSGEVNGAPWVYDYLGYLVPQIPNGVKQVTAIVGSVTRAIPHPDGQGGISPAGVVVSFYAVQQ
ncbi:MAG: hypothetical protein JST50_05085 [Bacteroidetes bacterium]|jgi:hypothetical protein|nr:hypothetical protein [Bacteroidota bacterium]